MAAITRFLFSVGVAKSNRTRRRWNTERRSPPTQNFEIFDRVGFDRMIAGLSNNRSLIRPLGKFHDYGFEKRQLLA